MSESSDWGCDGPISLPQPLPDNLGQTVPMSGFVFTVNGMRHDLTEVDREAIYSAPYAPERPV